MLQFTPTTLHLLASWRNTYLDSLPYAQDMHSESMISWMPGITCYLISSSDKPVGYIILNHSIRYYFPVATGFQIRVKWSDISFRITISRATLL